MNLQQSIKYTRPVLRSCNTVDVFLNEGFNSAKQSTWGARTSKQADTSPVIRSI